MGNNTKLIISDSDLEILLPVGIVVSTIAIICLLTRLILQFISPVFETKTMKLQFNLCLAIFISFVVFSIGMSSLQLDTEYVCVTVTIFDHYSLLASLVWVNILPANIYRRLVISPNVRANRTADWSAINNEMFIGWSAPAVAIAIALAMEYIDEIPRKYKQEYGKDVCWIQVVSPDKWIIYLPFLMTIIVNLILFVLICIKLKRSFAKRNKNVAVEKNYTLTYVKLFLMMGMKNFLLLLTPFFNHVILWVALMAVFAAYGIYVSVKPILKREVYDSLFQDKSSSTSGMAERRNAYPQITEGTRNTRF